MVKMCFIGDDGSHNIVVYQSTISTYKLEKDKGTNYVLIWKSKGIYSSQRKPLYTAFWHSRTRSAYRMRTIFDKDCVAFKQNNCATKIINSYPVYDLERSIIEYCLFGATNIVKNSDKEKWVYSSYGIVTYGINETFGSPEKKFSINFSEANTKLWLSYLFVNGKGIFKFETDNKTVHFATQFCLGIISNGFVGIFKRKCV